MMLVWKDPFDFPTPFHSFQTILNTSQPTVEQYFPSPISVISVDLKVWPRFQTLWPLLTPLEAISLVQFDACRKDERSSTHHVSLGPIWTFRLFVSMAPVSLLQAFSWSKYIFPGMSVIYSTCPLILVANHRFHFLHSKAHIRPISGFEVLLMVFSDSPKIALQEWPIKRGGKNHPSTHPETHAYQTN